MEKENEFSFPWARIGHFEADFITENNQKVKYWVELTRAYIKDFELISASRRPKEEIEEVEEKIDEMSLENRESTSQEAFECTKSLKSPKKSYKKGKKNARITTADYRSFNEYWEVAGTFLIYSTWFADFKHEMDENNQKIMKRQIEDADPIYLIDQHIDFLENERYRNVTKEFVEQNPDVTFDKLFEKHSAEILKLSRSDFEKFRTETVTRRAKTLIGKIERLGFVPGYTENSFPTSVKNSESKGECVFDDLVYSIDDNFSRPQHNYAKEEVIKKENDEKKDIIENISMENGEINFNFDPEKEAYLIASNAKELYANDDEIIKYFYQRYRLFSKLDQGIIMDREGWFSVTPERIAQHIAERVVINGVNIVVDAFTGVGGNAIQFALKGAYVIAIDLDPVRLKCARHNARVYGVEDYISFICADFFHVAATWANDKLNAPKIDAVFLSPPWGGPSYLNSAEFDLAEGCCPDGIEIFNASIKLSKNIAYFLPRTTKISQLVNLSHQIDGKCEIEQSSLNSKIKTITAYYGDLAA
ncbi:unnamed protein product [Caenorhabditis angaria]|uniref:Trimethylguanosine synthase n=1 Tax=Caenorhabditis angaria TaxID=860376 RepID=A0A9P1MWG0_9PELO|nr:unnamed protein product [Caenorhabditis angaria]